MDKCACGSELSGKKPRSRRITDKLSSTHTVPLTLSKTLAPSCAADSVTRTLTSLNTLPRRSQLFSHRPITSPPVARTGGAANWIIVSVSAQLPIPICPSPNSTTCLGSQFCGRSGLFHHNTQHLKGHGLCLPSGVLSFLNFPK